MLPSAISPVQWPDLAVTQEVFDWMAVESCQAPSLAVSEEASETDRAGTELESRKSLLPPFAQSDVGPTWLDVLLMRIRVVARATPAVRTPDEAFKVGGPEHCAVSLFRGVDVQLVLCVICRASAASCGL